MLAAAVMSSFSTEDLTDADSFWNSSSGGDLVDELLSNGSHPNNTTGLDGAGEDECPYQFGEDLETRFILVGVILPTICMVGIIGNISVIVVLSRKLMHSPNSGYLIALALCDILVMSMSILVYAVEILYDYFRLVDLYFAWITYLRVVYVLSHITQASTIILTVAATIERWLFVFFPTSHRSLCSSYKTLAWIIGVLVCVSSFTGTKYWEVTISHNAQCEGFGKYGLEPSTLLNNPTYVLVHSVWLSNMFFVFLPFLLLFVLNAAICIRLRQQAAGKNVDKSLHDITDSLISPTPGSLASAQDEPSRHQEEYKQQSREATHVLVVVVLVFLVCNTPAVLLTIVEVSDPEFLKTHHSFYGLARDGINFLTVINSSASFIIYIIFSNEFRRALRESCKRTTQQHPLHDNQQQDMITVCSGPFSNGSQALYQALTYNGSTWHSKVNSTTAAHTECYCRLDDCRWTWETTIERITTV